MVRARSSTDFLCVHLSPRISPILSMNIIDDAVSVSPRRTESGYGRCVEDGNVEPLMPQRFYCRAQKYCEHFATQIAARHGAGSSAFFSTLRIRRRRAYPGYSRFSSRPVGLGSVMPQVSNEKPESAETTAARSEYSTTTSQLRSNTFGRFLTPATAPRYSSTMSVCFRLYARGMKDARAFCRQFRWRILAFHYLPRSLR